MKNNLDTILTKDEKDIIVKIIENRLANDEYDTYPEAELLMSALRKIKE